MPWRRDHVHGQDLVRLSRRSCLEALASQRLGAKRPAVQAHRSRLGSLVAWGHRLRWAIVRMSVWVRVYVFTACLSQCLPLPSLCDSQVAFGPTPRHMNEPSPPQYTGVAARALVRQTSHNARMVSLAFARATNMFFVRMASTCW